MLNQADLFGQAKQYNTIATAYTNWDAAVVAGTVVLCLNWNSTKAYDLYG
jgi:hypothetical protein